MLSGELLLHLLERGGLLVNVSALPYAEGRVLREEASVPVAS
jgi:hypothetical protein